MRTGLTVCVILNPHFDIPSSDAFKLNRTGGNSNWGSISAWWTQELLPIPAVCGLHCLVSSHDNHPSRNFRLVRYQTYLWSWTSNGHLWKNFVSISSKSSVRNEGHVAVQILHSALRNRMHRQWEWLGKYHNTVLPSTTWVGAWLENRQVIPLCRLELQTELPNTVGRFKLS